MFYMYLVKISESGRKTVTHSRVYVTLCHTHHVFIAQLYLNNHGMVPVKAMLHPMGDFWLLEVSAEDGDVCSPALG